MTGGAVNVGFSTKKFGTGGAAGPAVWVQTQATARPFGSELALPSSVTDAPAVVTRGVAWATAVGGTGGGGTQAEAGTVTEGNGWSCPTFTLPSAANVPLTRNGKSGKLSGTGGLPAA